MPPPRDTVRLRRAVLARAKGHPLLHLEKGHPVLVIPELTSSSTASVDVVIHGKVLRATVPTDAIDPPWQRSLRRSEVVARRKPLLAAYRDLPSVGRLIDLLPELAQWIATALVETGASDACRDVASMEVRACWRGALDNYTLSPIPRDGRTLIFGDPDRKPYRLSQPTGLPKRSWQVGVQVIRGEVVEIGIVRPSVLRPTLHRIERAVGRLAPVERD